MAKIGFMATDEQISAVADKHGLSEEAVRELARAVSSGNHRSAQFSHPDLGGSGQWMAGGMTQVGDMFNNDLKAKVSAACEDLAGMADGGSSDQGASEGDSDQDGDSDQEGSAGDDRAEGQASGSQSKDWWPDGLGRPSSTGSQNDTAYAVFPDEHRLAIRKGDDVRVFDTGDHQISGVSQQQGSIEDTTFSSQNGTVRAGDLDQV